MDKLKTICIFCEECGEVIGIPPKIPLCGYCMIEKERNRRREALMLILNITLILFCILLYL